LDSLAIAWGWITDHATVLSAVISAISTGFIAWFAVSLVKASNQQGRDTSRAVQLAHDAFLATHRPKIIVREVYWDADRQGAITVMLGNRGDRPARIVEFHTEFDRTDERAIMHGGSHVNEDWIIERGAFEATTIPVPENKRLALGAFEEGHLDAVNFQGLVIYADDGGTLYRAVFKRTCRKGRRIFCRTGSLEDEYSD
jgi:hypothetical protein